MILLSFYGCSEQTYNPEYKRNENQNGVLFYYFKSDDSPRLEPESNFDNLEQIKNILSLIEDFPSHSLSDFEEVGTNSFQDKDSDGSSITIDVRECHKKTRPYSCVTKIRYSPSPINMAIAKASKYPQKYLFVSEEEYGNRWPYTFKFGLLSCKRYKDIVIHANHKVYAVNGSAMGAKYSAGNKKYHDAWSVRKTVYGTGRAAPPKGFIKKGLKLCRQ